MSQYDSLLKTSKLLINKFGRDVILRKRTKTGTSFDPTITTTDTTVKAVVTNFNIAEVDGTLIERTDKKFLMIPTILPEMDDLIVDGSEEYSVINNGVVNPGDTVLLFKVQGRK